MRSQPIIDDKLEKRHSNGDILTGKFTDVLIFCPSIHTCMHTCTHTCSKTPLNGHPLGRLFKFYTHFLSHHVISIHI